MGLFDRAHSTALLAMDLQRDFLQPDGRLTIAQGQISSLIEAMNRAIDRGARTRLAVVYTFNAYDLLDPSNLLRNFAAIKGSRGSLLDPRIHQVSPSTALIKRGPDAFSNPRLATLLADRGVKRLIIGGVYADACITATTRTALAKGFDVTLLRDGVGAANDSARDRACADLAHRGARLATVQSALG
ncbi:MAG: cysteine hydrolase [Caulobacteraceae bacterium]